MRATGFEPVRLTAGDFKSPVSAVPPRPRIMKVEVNSCYFNEGAIARPQPYILSIAQILKFVNTFLKKIFIFFGAERFSLPNRTIIVYSKILNLSNFILSV